MKASKLLFQAGKPNTVARDHICPFRAVCRSFGKHPVLFLLPLPQLRPSTAASHEGLAGRSGSDCGVLQRLDERLRRIATLRRFGSQSSAASSSCALQPAIRQSSSLTIARQYRQARTTRCDDGFVGVSGLPAKKAPVETAVSIMHRPLHTPQRPASASACRTTHLSIRLRTDEPVGSLNVHVRPS